MRYLRLLPVTIRSVLTFMDQSQSLPYFRSNEFLTDDQKWLLKVKVSSWFSGSIQSSRLQIQYSIDIISSTITWLSRRVVPAV
jgi:hypothetical protein